MELIPREYHDVIRTLLNSREPTKFTPLKIRMKQKSVPSRERKRKYPTEKRDLITRHVYNLIRLGFGKPTNSPESVSSP